MAENRSIGKSISYISRSLGRYIDSEAKHLNLGHFTLPFLTYLYEHNGVHQDLLAKDLQYDKSSAARAVASLEKNGYIRKTIDQNNRRRNTIEITDKAMDIREELYQILMLTNQKLFTGFSESQIEVYFEYTERLNMAIKAMLEEEK